MRIQKTVLALSLMTTLVQPLWADHDGEKKFPSPDGKFAFRYGAGEPTQEAEEETEVFNLIDARTGKALLEVAKSDPDYLNPRPFDSIHRCRIRWLPARCTAP